MVKQSGLRRGYCVHFMPLYTWTRSSTKLLPLLQERQVYVVACLIAVHKALAQHKRAHCAELSSFNDSVLACAKHLPHLAHFSAQRRQTSCTDSFLCTLGTADAHKRSEKSVVYVSTIVVQIAFGRALSTSTKMLARVSSFSSEPSNL